ncbi:MAG TPA: response regulator transcription factor [bacterium]|nr:response regulator transcription factor [bacterium]
MRSILVVEDDPSVVKLLHLSLERDRCRVTSAADGRAALEIAQRDRPDLVILDLGLPDLDGLEVCRRLRATSDVPILILTGAAEEVDKLLGLSMGADDYVTKPFSPREVAARVKAILNRTTRPRQERVLRRHDLELDLERRRVLLAGQEVSVTTSEFTLLRVLLESPERVFSRDELLTQIYPRDEAAVVERAIDVHIANLRRKLGDSPADPRHIATVRGAGYKLL